jgi:signal transduction histidine kinase
MAASLRRQSEGILAAWEEMARREMPGVVGRLAPAEVRDHLPALLEGIADALESTGPGRAHTLEQAAPAQGHSRFRRRYNLREALTENRLFRQAILNHVEPEPLNRDQQVAINAAVDVVVQHGVLALFEDQQEQLRAVAEAELRYLSFLSHELGNSLNGVRLMLASISKRLGCVPMQRHESVLLDELQHVISDTIKGMRQFLEHERLRKANLTPEVWPVALGEVAASVAHQFLAEAEQKGLRLFVEVAPDAVVRADPTLIGIVLRNLIGNAVKYAAAGTVQIVSKYSHHADPGGGRWALMVSDEGPGIAQHCLVHIFDAFRRGEVNGQHGMGLGLAIASYAAKLLGAELGVHSKAGEGSTFTLTFEAQGGAAEGSVGAT